MQFELKSKIKKYETKLNERYENLIKTLNGDELTDEELDTYDYTAYYSKIDFDELDIAIDDFITMLKKVKKKFK